MQADRRQCLISAAVTPAIAAVGNCSSPTPVDDSGGFVVPRQFEAALLHAKRELLHRHRTDTIIRSYEYGLVSIEQARRLLAANTLP